MIENHAFVTLPGEDAFQDAEGFGVASGHVAKVGIGILGDGADEPGDFAGVAFADLGAHVLNEALGTLFVGRVGTAGASGDLDVLFPNGCFVGTGFDEDYLYAEPETLEAEGFTPSFERPLAGGITTDADGGADACHGGDHDDVSSMLPAHDGHDGLGDGDVGEEIGLKLFAEFGKGNVFGESGGRESGVVDEDVNALMIANNVGEELRKECVVGDIETANFDAFGDAFAGGKFVESGAGGGIAHGGDDVEPAECEFHGGEHSDAAGGSGDESDLSQFVIC